MQPHDLEGLLTAVAQDFTSPKTQHSVNLAQPEFLIIGCRRKKVKSLLKVKIKIPNAYYKLPPPLNRNYLLTHACTVSNISQQEQIMCEGKCLCVCVGGVGFIDYSLWIITDIWLHRCTRFLLIRNNDNICERKYLSIQRWTVSIIFNFLFSLRQQYRSIITKFTWVTM